MGTHANGRQWPGIGFYIKNHHQISMYVKKYEIDFQKGPPSVTYVRMVPRPQAEGAADHQHPQKA